MASQRPPALDLETADLAPVIALSIPIHFKPLIVLNSKFSDPISSVS